MNGTDNAKWALGLLAGLAGLGLAVVGVYEMVKSRPPVSNAAIANNGFVLYVTPTE